MKLTQNEVESALGDIVPRGVRRDIARETGTYDSVVYAQYNPDDERKSPAYQTLRDIAVMDRLHPEIGQLFVETFLSLRETSRPAQSKVLDPNKKIGDVASEVADIVNAHCQGKPYETVLAEIIQAELALRKYKQAVIAQRNNLSFATGNEKVERLRARTAA